MRFLFGYDQSEVVLDELSDFLSDLLRVCTRTNDADAKIICIPTVIEALVAVVERISARQLLPQSINSSYFLLDALKFVFCFLLSLQAIPFSSEGSNLVGVVPVQGILLSFLPLIEPVFHRAHERIQFM